MQVRGTIAFSSLVLYFKNSNIRLWSWPWTLNGTSQWRIVFEGFEKTLRHFSVVLMSPWDILVQRYSVRYFPKRWNHKFAKILSFETFPSLSLFFGYSERKEKPFAHFLLCTLWICIPIMSRNLFCILLLIVVFKIRNNEP